MTRLFHAFGIDYAQWRALTVAALKMDLRVSAIGGAIGRRNASRVATVISLLAFYGMMGGFASILVIAIRDVTMSGTIVLSYLMFMVGTMVLLDQQSVITSPDDYVVLGFRPVGSRTYFAVRLTNVLVYTLALTTAFGAIPMAAYIIGHGFDPRMAIAAVLAFYLSTTFTTLSLVLVYAWMLRVIGADRLKRTLSYVQLVMGFAMYGGYFMMSQVFDRTALAALALPATRWVYAYPPTWFASYLALAEGHAAVPAIEAAACSVLAIVLLGAGLAGRLSLQYAEELGALTAASSRPAAGKAGRARRRPVWFTGGEARAVALLVRAQFRNDQKFRMGVLGVMPLTVLYMFMSLRDGPLPDPFTMGWSGAGRSFLVTMAVLAFPATLRATLTRSDAFRASWIYYTAPVDRSRLIRATKNVVVAFFLAPYLIAVAAAMTYFTGQPVHVAVHVFFLGLISHLLLQVMMLAEPELPFSQPMQKGTRSGLMFVMMAIAALSAVGVVPVLATVVYVSPVRIAMGVAALAAASWAVDWLTRVRVERRAEGLEFAA